MSKTKKPEPFVLPPHLNAEPHRQLMERLGKMTKAEQFMTLVHAGICDKNGKLLPPYNGEEVQEPREKKDTMKRCHHCKSARLVEKTLPETLEVAGYVFTAQLPALVCEACGESSYVGEDLHRFELAAARKLAELGEPSGEAFKFMRKSIGLKAVELAQLLNIAPETLSRWENGKLALDEGVFFILGDLVEDHCTGSQRTLDRLKTLRAPRTNKPSHIRIELF